MDTRFESLHSLLEHGQSYWLDNLTRAKLRGGELAQRVSEQGLRGVTSNPAIFHKAISGSGDYREQIDDLVGDGLGPYGIYEQLVLTDIRDACDVLRPVFDASKGADGFVSLELSPYLAHDADGSMRDARRLFRAVDRPNLMIKIPGTPAATATIEQMLYEGVNINITLLFSVERYEAVAEAYLRALERRLADDMSIHDVASVASFFLSRIDVLVDGILAQHLRATRDAAERSPAGSLLGEAAIASAKLARRKFLRITESDRWKRLEAAGARPQRLLWASTSRKNPLYSDVLYVEPLIGRDTVNTMTDETIAAFADHGRVVDSLDESIEDAQRTMTRLRAAGIDIDAVTWQLVHEGIRKFVDPFDALLVTIANERNRRLGGSGLPRLAPKAVRDAVELVAGALGHRRVGRRLFARDASLWTRDPAMAEEARNRLDWLEAPSSFLKRLEPLREFVDDVRGAGFEEAVLLGMGGSSLAADVARATFGTADGWLRLTVLDDTDPEAVSLVRDRLDPQRTLFLVSSKSGTTTETLDLYRIFFAWLDERTPDPGSRFVAITDPGSPLADEAAARKFRHIFENPVGFGGRYSALSWFGLIPMALQGIDVEAILRSAQRMRRSCGPGVPASVNPGIVLGAALGRLAADGRDKITLSFSRDLTGFGDWVEQLLAESTGKDGTGLLPVVGERLAPPDRYGRDRVFVHLSTRAGEDTRANAALDALEAAGHPVVRLGIDALTDIGAAFYRWEIATAVAGAVLGVDAFDQPNVESAKSRTRALLERHGADLLGEEDTPLAQDGSLALFAAPSAPGGGNDPGDALREFLDGAGDSDWISILAWMRPTRQRRSAFAALRAELRERHGVATTLGFGPRYLHSTGQIHKGGPATGLFLVITTDPQGDVPIPGESYGLATLHRAQWMGDLQALRDSGRRVLRVHIRGSVERGLGHLRRELAHAMASAGA